MTRSSKNHNDDDHTAATSAHHIKLLTPTAVFGHLDPVTLDGYRLTQATLLLSGISKVSSKVSNGGWSTKTSVDLSGSAMWNPERFMTALHGQGQLSEDRDAELTAYQESVAAVTGFPDEMENEEQKQQSPRKVIGTQMQALPVCVEESFVPEGMHNGVCILNYQGVTNTQQFTENYVHIEMVQCVHRIVNDPSKIDFFDEEDELMAGDETEVPFNYSHAGGVDGDNNATMMAAPVLLMTNATIMTNAEKTTDAEKLPNGSPLLPAARPLLPATLPALPLPMLWPTAAVSNHPVTAEEEALAATEVVLSAASEMGEGLAATVLAAATREADVLAASAAAKEKDLPPPSPILSVTDSQFPDSPEEEPTVGHTGALLQTFLFSDCDNFVLPMQAAKKQRTKAHFFSKKRRRNSDSNLCVQNASNKRRKRSNSDDLSVQSL